MFAIDLSPRQSARTIEQAIRHQTEVHLQPRHRPEAPPINGRLDDRPMHGQTKDHRFITIVVHHDEHSQNQADGKHSDNQPNGRNFETSPNEQDLPNNCDYRDLLGVYCDVSLLMGEHRYFFNVDVVGVETDAQPPSDTYLTLACPEQIQVAQRRRYRRINLAHSTQVSLQWTGEEKKTIRGIGWLCNISQDGLACRTEATNADQLCIGEPLYVEFNLGGGEDSHYSMDALLCSKTPAGSQGKIILGIQFLADSSNEKSSKSVEALKKHLAAWYAKQPHNHKKA